LNRVFWLSKDQSAVRAKLRFGLTGKDNTSSLPL
jgi:hypothetical protein